MVVRDETEIEYVDMTPVIKTDTFVNEPYKEATISNIGRFLELEPNQKDGAFRKRAEERLGFGKVRK